MSKPLDGADDAGAEIGRVIGEAIADAVGRHIADGHTLIGESGPEPFIASTSGTIRPLPKGSE